MRTAKTTNAKPAGSRDVLPPLTQAEARNGWSEQTLDAYLRGACSEAYTYRKEILGRWREQERIARERVPAFKKDNDLGDPSEKRDLDRMEAELAHASAMANRAADLLESL